MMRYFLFLFYDCKITGISYQDSPVQKTQHSPLPSFQASTLSTSFVCTYIFAFLKQLGSMMQGFYMKYPTEPVQPLQGNALNFLSIKLNLKCSGIFLNKFTYKLSCDSFSWVSGSDIQHISDIFKSRKCLCALQMYREYCQDYDIGHKRKHIL